GSSRQPDAGGDPGTPSPEGGTLIRRHGRGQPLFRGRRRGRPAISGRRRRRPMPGRPIPRPGTAAPTARYWRRPGPMALPRQFERLQAEGGKRREPPAQPDHDEGAGVKRGDGPSARPGEGGEKADDERPEDIDQDRAPREADAEQFGDEGAEPEPRDAAERPAETDPQIGGNHPGGATRSVIGIGIRYRHRRGS